MKLRTLSLCLLAVIVTALLAFATTVGAQRSNTTSDFGIVDMDKVQKEFRALQESDSQYQKVRAEKLRALQEQYLLRLLDQTELQAYQDLKQVAAPTEAQRARLQELRSLSPSRETQLEELENKGNLTDEERALLNHLKEVRDGRAKEIADLESKTRQEIDQKYEELMNPLKERINSTLAQIAKDQSLSFVLYKDVVLFGGKDITDSLLSKLNTS